MSFDEWFLLTKGKTFEEYFSTYLDGIYNFEGHLTSLKMSYITYCKENNLEIKND